MNRIYFDNAATTPLAPEVKEEMLRQTDNFGNPSSIHHFGRKAKAVIEESRKKIAALLHCNTSEIFFTSGGTEADNLALYGALYGLQPNAVITSPIEHHAVLHTLEYHCRKQTIPLLYVNLQPDGHVDYNHLEDLLKKYPKSLVSLMHVNNEIGNISSLKKIGELVYQYHGYFHSDTVQSIGHFSFELNKLPVDFITCSAHKLHGPKGIGFLYINKRIKIPPLIYGGGQEMNMRAGTESVMLIAALRKALELAQTSLEQHREYLSTLKKSMIQGLLNIHPAITFNGDAEGKSSPSILNVRFPARSLPEMLVYQLDLEGLAASGGSACTSGSLSASHVLHHLRVPASCPSIRFSFSRYNTPEEVHQALHIIEKVLKQTTCM